MNAEQTNNDYGWLPFDLTDISYLLRKHMLLILFVPLLSALAGFAYRQMTPPTHVAESVFLVEPNVTELLRVDYTEDSGTVSEDVDLLTSLPDALVSDSSLLEVLGYTGVTDPAGMTDPAGVTDPAGGTDSVQKQLPTDLLQNVRHRYEASLIPETRLISLTIEDPDPSTAIEIGNQLFSLLVSRLQKQRMDEVDRARIALTAQADIAAENAMAVEDKLARVLREQYGTTAAGQEQNLHEERLIRQISALNMSKAELSRFSGIVTALESVDPGDNPDRIFQLVGADADSNAAMLIREKAAAKAQFALTRQTYAPNHELFRAAATSLAEAEGNVTKHAQELKEGAKARLATLKTRVANSADEMFTLERNFGKYKDVRAGIRGLQEEVDRSWETHKSLQARLMKLDLAPADVPSFMTQIAGPVVRKYRSRIPLLAGVGVGFFIVFAVICWRNRHGLPFTSRDQPTEYLRVQQVGEFQSCKSRDPLTAFSAMESSPELRGAIATSAGLETIQITALRQTATVAGLCVSFARRMAKGGLSTVVVTLIDDYEAETADSVPEEFPGEHGDTNLRFSANLLIDPAAFDRRIEQLREKFDRVIIDTTELPENESKTAVAARCDATIIAIDGEGVRPRKAYRQFVDLLKLRGIQTVVTVYLREPSFRRVQRRGRRGTPLNSMAIRNFFRDQQRRDGHAIHA